MGLEALLSTQVIDTTTVGRAVMTAVDAAAARAAIGAGTSSFNGAYSSLTGIPSTFAPSAHKTSHATGGADALSPSDIGAVPTSRQLTINGTAYDLSADRSWTIAAGISSLNGLTGATQTFATATTGTDFSITSSGTAHTFSIPDASATARGLVTTAAQTLAGRKTFPAGISIPANGSTTLGIRGDNGPAGVYFANNATTFLISTQGGVVARFNNYGFPAVNLNGGLALSSSDTTIGSPDVFLIRDAANALALRNGVNAQTFLVYNTFTSTTSFERVSLGWSGNVCTLETQAGSGGGTLRGLKIGSASSSLIGLWGVTPIVQPTTAVAAATRVGGGGTTLTDTDTFDGYTLAQIVKALRNIGALA